jgi:hypothetical protein
MRTALTLRDQTQEAARPSAFAELALLDEVQVASPCPARWEEMTGDDRSRYCRSCERVVYNLSGMRAADALALIRQKEGSLCVRLFRRADGTILTADCPEGLRSRLDKYRRRAGLSEAVKAACPVILLALATILLANAAFACLAGFLDDDGCATMGVPAPERSPNGAIRLPPAVNPGQVAGPEAGEEKK